MLPDRGRRDGAGVAGGAAGAPVAVGAVGVETGALSPSKKFFTVSMKDFTFWRMPISFMIAW